MRKNAAIIAWLAAGVLIALALWTSLSSLNWAVIIKWLPRLSQGALLTLELVAIAVVAGLILALPMGIARASKHWYVRALPYGYIFFFRGTPLLVQLFLVYYGLAQFDAVRQGPL